MASGAEKKLYPLRALDFQQVEILRDLPASLIDELVKRARGLRIPANAEIIEHMRNSREVYLLLQGNVRVNMMAASGRQITYQVLHAGEMFGELAAIDNLPRSAAVTADTDVLVAELSAQDFIELARSNADFAHRIMVRLASLSRWLTSRLFEYHTYNVRGRVYVELLRLAESAPKLAVLRVSDRDMASRVGTTRENVSRIKAGLEEQHIIKRSRAGIQMLNREALEKLLVDCEFN